MSTSDFISLNDGDLTQKAIEQVARASKSAVERYCSAGRNFYVILSNGNIYRCWYHQKELCGSVAERWLTPIQSTRCLDRRCVDTCEPPDCLIWEDGKLQIGSHVAYADRNWINPQRDELKFQISLVYACNYKCPYCIAGSHLVNMAEDKKKWASPEQWLEFWNWLGTQHQKVSAVLAGGEPTIFPRFDEMLVSISKLRGEQNRLCTNLSITKPLEPLFEGEYTNWLVYAAAHPANSGFDLTKFVERAVRLKKHVPVEIVFVDAEINAPYKKEVVERCREAGLWVGVLKDQLETKWSGYTAMAQELGRNLGEVAEQQAKQHEGCRVDKKD